MVFLFFLLVFKINFNDNKLFKQVNFKTNMVYKQTEPFTCGPCSYMEGFYENKNIKKELELHEIGRIKPSRLFLGISFLEINSNLFLYIKDTKMTQKIVDMVHYDVIEDFDNVFKNYYNSLIKKYKNNIIKISDSDILFTVLNKANDFKKPVLVLSHSKYWIGKGGAHWICFKGIKNNKFIFSDSILGKEVYFTKSDILKMIKMLDDDGFSFQFVCDISVEELKH